VSNLDLVNDSFLSMQACQIFHKIYEIFIDSEFIDKDSYLCLKLVNSGKIEEYNKRYRGNDMLTDVLSFPSEFKQTGFLGDMIIDVTVAEKQRGNKNLQEELAELFIHGFLHLLGYDHLKKDDKKIMNKQEEYLKKHIFEKGLIPWTD